MALSTGDRAPAFTLVDQNGDKVKLTDLKGRKVLVYFYPKADTPGCTTQSCELSAIKDDVDVQIIGISPDAPAKQKKFDDKYSLGFPLLSDADHTVAEKYGAWGEKSMYGKKYMGIVRSAFLIDEKGKIAEAWPKISPKDTPKKLLAALGRVSGLDPAEILPHREPFAFITTIDEVAAGESARCSWVLTGDEDFFAGHFPGRPTLPGVLMLEALAQTGAVAALQDPRFAGKLLLFGGVDKARFRRQVLPGDTLTLQVTMGRMSARAGKGHGVASVAGDTACEADLLFVVADAP